MRYRFTSLLCLILFTCPPTLRAATLFEQQHINFGNPAPMGTAVGAFSNQLLTHPSPVDDQRAKTFDNFSLSQDASITQLLWTGNFNNPFLPSFTPTVNFNVEIYEDSNGPNLGALVYSGGVSHTETVIPDELQQNGGSVLSYQTNGLTPFSLSAGDYWLAIYAAQNFSVADPGDEEPSWAWHFANGDSKSYNFDALFDSAEPGLAITKDFSFSILGDVSNPGLVGDFDNNQILDVNDINLLAAEMRSGTNNANFDLTNDGLVNSADHTAWVTDVYGTLLGDANLDFRVVFADFLKLSQSFGLSGNWENGDFDGDGSVLFGDFLILGSTFGQTAGGAGEPSSGVAVVPEPSTPLNMFFVLLFGYLAKCRETGQKKY